MMLPWPSCLFLHILNSSKLNLKVQATLPPPPPYPAVSISRILTICLSVSSNFKKYEQPASVPVDSCQFSTARVQLFSTTDSRPSTTFILMVVKHALHFIWTVFNSKALQLNQNLQKNLGLLRRRRSLRARCSCGSPLFWSRARSGQGEGREVKEFHNSSGTSPWPFFSSSFSDFNQ